MAGPFRIGPHGGIFQVGARTASPCFPFPTEIRLNSAATDYVRAVTGAHPLPPANAVYVHVDGTVMRMAGGRVDDVIRAIVDPCVRIPVIRAFVTAWARACAPANPAAEVVQIECAMETLPPYAHLWIYQQLERNPLWVKVLLVQSGMVDSGSPLAIDATVVAALRDTIAPGTALARVIDQLRTAHQRYFPTAAPAALPPGLRAAWEERLRRIPRVALEMLTSSRLSEGMTLFLAHHFGVREGFPASVDDVTANP